MSTPTSSLPVLVSGGGIGGLAAALALVRQGFNVQVFEQAAEIGEIGAGIQLGPNAFHAFDGLVERQFIRSSFFLRIAGLFFPGYNFLSHGAKIGNPLIQ